MIAERLRPAAPSALRFPLLVLALSLGALLTSFGGCALSTGGIPAVDAGVSCETDTQCDDGNACTTDTCVQSMCAHGAVADGPLPASAQTPGNCQKLVCMGGEPTSQNDDTNTPVSSNPCVLEECSMGMALQDMTANDDKPCTLNGTNGSCLNGGCVVLCKTAADCPSTNPCVIPSCDGATGMCTSTNVPDGTPTPGVTQVMDDCKEQVCVGGVSTSEANDGYVPPIPPALAGCADAKCTMGVPSNPLHAVDSPCSTYMGTKPGFCDAAGSCVECTMDNECPGTSDDCGHPACTANACTMVYAAANTPTSTNPPQISGTCQQIVCDGMGGHMTVTDDSAVPSSGTVCITDSCSGGKVVMTDNPGVVCGTSMTMQEQCTASGQCGCQTNGDCVSPQTCGGGGVPLVCGCTPKTCANLDKTCGGPFPDGCGGMVTCNDGSQDGTETDVDCGGVAAGNSTCAIGCGQGKKCNAGTDCQSGFCADGVCCNVACTGLTCQACSAAKKGQGADGVCGAVVLGQDPHGNCSTMGTASCGESGGCNGSGACSTYAAGTVCQAATCSGTVLTKQETCNSSMMCSPQTPPTQDCAPYVCTGGACTLTCANDGQCAATAYCNTSTGKCMPKLGNGVGTCAASDQCSSNVCGTNGTCCAASCAASPPCGLTGACAAGTGACLDATAGTACSKVVSCTNGATSGVLTTDTTCDGVGNCSASPTPSNCTGNATCASGTTCNNGCGSNDGNCVSGDYCNGGTCQPKGAPGATCSAADQCASGVCGTTGTGNCCASACMGGSCGATGCDASGNCTYPGPSTSCSSATCSGVTFTPASTCDGAGNCVAGTPAACGSDFSCNGNTCGTSCTVGGSGGCAPGTTCLGGTQCGAPLAPGQSCTTPNECTTNLCFGPAGGEHCCTAGCNTGGPCGAASCDGTGACAYPTGSCGTDSCTGSTLTPASTCGGGSCNPSTAVPCPGNASCMNGTTCNPPTCGSTPGTSGCAASYYCDGVGTGTCQPQLTTGMSCTAGAGYECLGGICTPGVNTCL
jgi:hypothetical protein